MFQAILTSLRQCPNFTVFYGFFKVLPLKTDNVRTLSQILDTTHPTPQQTHTNRQGNKNLTFMEYKYKMFYIYNVLFVSLEEKIPGVVYSVLLILYQI